MKAVRIKSYGGVDVLQIDVVAVPSPKKGQIGVKVHAAGLNPFDTKIISGMYKEHIPLQLPVTLGGDFSGVVTKLGEAVDAYLPGDEVYGTANVLSGGSGAFAQELVANAQNVAPKPKSATFEEAAALVLVGVSAVQAIEDHIGLQTGQNILIHGGAGGIGHVAIQLAKSHGAFVTTTVSSDDMAFARRLGADEVIDYKTHSFETLVKDFDAVFDTVGGETTTRSFTVLKKWGILVSMLGLPDQTLARQHGVIAIGQGTKTDTQHLTRLSELVDTGKIKVVIDKVYSFEQAREAAVLQESHPRGKVVLKMNE